MNKFVSAVNDVANMNGVKTYTENGAVARNSTGSALLDLYGTIGAMRSRSEDEIVSAFKRAWNENPLYALKMAFYARNIRGGLGERDTARVCLKWVAENYPRTMSKNFDNVVTFGRVDDLYTFVDTPVENEMWSYLKAIIYNDLRCMKNRQSASLAAKWLKSVNTSSAESRSLGRRTARAFGLTEAQYRKMLSVMRKYLNVVEVAMSKGDWTGIDYEAVPAYAMKKYKKAFKTHCPDLFNTYLSKVERGEAKINSSTMYPYDLVKPYVNGAHFDRVAETQWKALPNYIEGENNVLVMADVSDSMTWNNHAQAMATSVGLAIYFAERNKGAFKNLYMTFSSRPTFIKINPNSSLKDKVDAVMRTGVGYSTNLEGAFMEVLNTAIRNNVPQKDMPKAIVVISDMEINPYFRGYGLDFVSEMAARFSAAGYIMPQLVLWNVEARNSTFHGSKNNPYVQFASGSATSTFKAVLETLGMNAYEAMMKVLNDKMYDSVVL